MFRLESAAEVAQVLPFAGKDFDVCGADKCRGRLRSRRPVGKLYRPEHLSVLMADGLSTLLEILGPERVEILPKPTKSQHFL